MPGSHCLEIVPGDMVRILGLCMFFNENDQKNTANCKMQGPNILIREGVQFKKFLFIVRKLLGILLSSGCESVYTHTCEFCLKWLLVCLLEQD